MAVQATEATDAKGRPAVEAMSDSEKLTELILIMRAVADGLENLGSSSMGKMIGLQNIKF